MIVYPNYLHQIARAGYIYRVVDLKVLVSSVYDDDPEHIKISSHLAKVFSRVGESIFFLRKIWRNIKYVLLCECSFAS